MTVSNTKSFNEHISTGTETSWPFTFDVTDPSQVRVYVIDTDTIVTDVTASATIDMNTKTVTYGPIPVDHILRIERKTDITQEVDFNTQGPFLPQVLEDAFDKLTLIAQEVSNKVDDYIASGIRYKGEWKDGVVYQKNDTVSKFGSLYIALVDHRSDSTNTPEDLKSNSFWQLVARRGEKGDTNDAWTYADLKQINGATKPHVYVSGRVYPGDGGAGLFKWESGDQSANVSNDPLEGFWVAPSSDPTGASGAWRRVVIGSFGRLEWFGVANDGTQDCSSAFNKIVDEGLNVFLGPGKWLFTQPGNMPDVTVDGNSWDESNPFRLVGSGMNQTEVIVDVPDGDYGIKHPTTGSTASPRGQNGIGLHVSDITFRGKGGWNKTLHALGISNSRMPTVERCAFRGFPLGKGIHFWAHAAGGIFNPIVRDCYFGQLKYSYDGTYTWYEPSDLADLAVHTAIHLDGPIDGVGKVTDALIEANRFDTVLICVDGVGHGTTYADAGATNIQFAFNMPGNEGFRKVEEGTLEGVGTNTFTLRTAANTYPTYIGNQPVGWSLWLKDTSGVWHVQEITAYDAATRTVTTAASFPFTPAVGTEYRISFATADAVSKAGRSQLPCVVLIDEGSYHHRMVANRSEENNAAIVIHDRGKIKYPKVISVANSWRIQNGRGHYWSDGTPFVPSHEFDLTRTDGRGLIAPNVSATDMADKRLSQMLIWKVNNTGTTLKAGDLVTHSTTDLAAWDVRDGGRVMAIVADTGKDYAPGELTPCLARGSVGKLTVSADEVASVVATDILIWKADGTLTVLTDAYQQLAIGATRRLCRVLKGGSGAAGTTYTVFVEVL